MVANEATQSGLPSLDWTPRGTGASVPVAAPCARPPPRGVQTNLGKSLLVLESPVLVEILSLFGGGADLPPPSRTDTGVGPGEISRAYPLMVWTLSGAQLKDTEEFPPSQKILAGGLAERCQENCPPSGKVLGRGARLGKKSRNTQGSAERCRSPSIVGD